MVNKKLLFLSYSKLQTLIIVLQNNGFTCVGPQIKYETLVYDKLTNMKQLPWGIIDHQKPGYYRIEKTSAPHAFAWTNGPQAIKPYLFKSKEITWQAEKKDDGNMLIHCQSPSWQRIAFIGARPCDISGMKILDRIFMDDHYADPFYKKRRDNFFVIAVNCSRCSENCFCVSTGDGPKATKFFDIAMTEINHGFVTEVGSSEGEKIIRLLKLPRAQQKQIIEANNKIYNAATQQIKKLPPVNLRKLLFSNLNHLQWRNVARRCLSCAICTQVCPTCFCQSCRDKPILEGTNAIHYKTWDSCFTDGHSYIHGNLIRDNTHKRYRQWLTHKVGSWHDQFGMSGCVGCGRCITWCPVGIDITAEINSFYNKKGRVNKN